MTATSKTKNHCLDASTGLDDLDFRSMFDHVFGDSFMAAPEPMGTAGNAVPSVALPVTVSETDRSRVVRITIPGLDRNEIEVHHMPGRLTISGRKKSVEDSLRSRGRDYVEVAFRAPVEGPMPGGSDHGAVVQADYDRGVLTVWIPKTMAESPKAAEAVPATEAAPVPCLA